MKTKIREGYMYSPYYLRDFTLRSYSFPYPMRTLEWELNVLESYRDELEYEKEEINREIEDVEAGIHQLADLIEEGEEPNIPYNNLNLWAPYPFGTVISREKEVTILKNVEKDLSSQVERIKKRLKELETGDNQ